MPGSLHPRVWPAWLGGEWSDPSAARLFRTSLATLVALVACAPWIARSALAVLGADSTAPLEWVPASFPARQAYDRFTAEFGSGDVVMVSWPGCTLAADEVDRFVAATAAATARDPQGRPWFDAVVTGRDAVSRLTAPPLSLDRATALERLRGVVVGPDGQRTCVAIGLTREGLADRRRAVAWISTTLAQTTSARPDEIHLAGSVIDNVAVDEASDESLRVYGGPAAAIVFLLTWVALRSFRYAVVVFVLALVCVGLSFTTLRACGDRMNPVLIVMPLLVLTLGVSGGIHLVNYLVAEYRTGQGRGAAWRAVKVGFLPCLLSSGTTAIGLISLVVSELEPIRVFGFHAAIGVLGTLVVLFLVLPGIFARWPIRRRLDAASGSAAAVGWAGLTTRHGAAITALTAVGLGAAGAGISGIRTSVGIDTLFTPTSRVVRDYEWLEREIGPLVPIEVVLRFTPDSDVRTAERLDVVQEVGDALRGLAPVSGVTSAAVFLPEFAAAGPLVSATRRVVAARRLEEALTSLADMSLIREDATGQRWRITARASALAGLDYTELLRRVRGTVEPIVADHGGAARGITADFTGAMPLINAIQKTLLRDLFSSFLSACGLITVVMMLVEGGVVAGLVAMIPNVFPMVILFGVLGWAGATLDIGSVMTASVALGMAVDGTFHFLTFYRHALRDAASLRSATDRAAAIRAAFQHAAGALVQSALVCGLGILAFAASPFAPTQRFAWMLSLLVGLALVGDLVVLPAMLATRAGRWFRRVTASRRVTSPCG